MAEFITIVALMLFSGFLVAYKLRKKMLKPVSKHEAKAAGEAISPCPVGGAHEFDPDDREYFTGFNDDNIVVRNKCSKCDKYTKGVSYTTEESIIALIMQTIECTQEEAYWIQFRYLDSKSWTNFKAALFTDLIRARQYITTRKMKKNINQPTEEKGM